MCVTAGMVERTTLSLSMLLLGRHRHARQARPAACKGCRRRDQTSSPPLRAALKGRTAWKLSRYLTLRLRFFCMDGLRGSPRIERLPSARGPNSIRPWNQPMASPSASALAVVSSISLRETVEKRAPTGRSDASQCRVGRTRGRDRR